MSHCEQRSLNRCASCAAQVITQKDKDDKTLEPYEEAVVEVPEAHMGGVVDLMGSRKGQMVDMAASAEGLNRVTYVIPTRGLLGLRNSILTATKARTLFCWKQTIAFVFSFTDLEAFPGSLSID